MSETAIIIGSGVAGLISAALLAQNGMKVSIFEQHSAPGGYATAFFRKEYKFEVSLHLLGDLDEGGMVKKMLEDIGVIPDLKFFRADKLYKSVFPDNEIVADNYENYTQNLCKIFPDEKEEIQKLFHVFVKIRNNILTLNEKSEKQAMIDIFRDAKYVARFQNYSLADMLNEFIISDKLKAIISQYWGYFGLPPSQLSAIYYAYVWTEYFMFGGYYPLGTSQELSNKLVDIIEQNGGKVYLKSKVKKILLEDKKAIGIELENDIIHYAEHIISNVNLKSTFEKMIGYEHFNKRYINKLNNITPSLSNIQIYIILDIDFHEKYGETNHEIFVNGQYDIEQAYLDIIEDRVEIAPFGITIYENIIKGYNQEGKSTVSLFQLSSYRNWKNMSKNEYKKKKEAVLSCMLDRLNKMFPGINEHIIFTDISTPITNERYTSNTEGAIYGAAQTVNQVMNKRLNQQTPISNLMLVGAWSSPASGYSGCIWSGYGLAKRILKNKGNVE